MRYRRLILKLSGESLAEEHDVFSRSKFDAAVSQVIQLHQAGIQVGVVVGAGNLFRGRMARDWGLEAADADQIGMLATVANGLLLARLISARNVCEVRVLTALQIGGGEVFDRMQALEYFKNGRVLVFVGGTGNPFVTTDYAAVQRAIEVRAEAVFAAKFGVDGLLTDDPNQRPEARQYATVTYDTVIRDQLQAIDLSATVLARDHDMPLHLFNAASNEAAFRIAVGGENVGTLVGAPADVIA